MAMPQQWARGNVVYGSPQRPAYINVLYFVPNATITVDQAESDAFATALESAIHAAMKSVLTTNSAFLGVSTSLHDGTLVFDSTSTAHAGAGTTTGDEEPDYVAAVVQKRTLSGGKSGRGRWFIGGVAESNTDENKLNSGAIALYDGLGGAFRSNVTAGSNVYESQLHSTKLNTLIRIDSTRTDFLLGRQSRRRLRPAI